MENYCTFIAAGVGYEHPFKLSGTCTNLKQRSVILTRILLSGAKNLTSPELQGKS